MRVEIKERPILFSGAMVRAILEGRKTVTRRVVKGMALQWLGDGFEPEYVANSGNALCPYGHPGDRLWVRETWCSPEKEIAGFAADGRCGAWLGNGAGGRVWVGHGFIREAPGYAQCFQEPARTWGIDQYGGKWRPSIHMPRWASRILLEITAVHVERLQDISHGQAMAEGVLSCESALDPDGNGYSPYELFSALWVSINGHDSWHANPWVWVVEFKRVEVAHA